MLEPLEDHARVRALHDERLDRGATDRQVQRRPDNHDVCALTGGHVDLLAVEHVLACCLVELGGGADRSRVRTCLRLGDRHRRPLVAEARKLLVVGDRRDGGVAEPLAGHREQQADVGPAQLDDAEGGRHVRPVLVALCLVGHAAGGSTSTLGAARVVHAVHERGEHVELFGPCVLLAVVLARDRHEHLIRDGVSHLQELVELLRCFEIDHRSDSLFFRPGGLDEDDPVEDTYCS